MKTKKKRRTIKVSTKSLSARVKNKFVMRLFVAGATARSRQAIMRVQQLCKTDDLKRSCDVKIIDIYQQPELARANQIVATPTLIIEFPKPERRFIGNLVNVTALLEDLGFISKVNIVL